MKALYFSLFSFFSLFLSLLPCSENESARIRVKAVYHDDFADYSTNECTMDGTTSLVYYISSPGSRNKQDF